MDAREWEQSQSRRSSIKRPWDEENSHWNGATLPPMEAVPYRRPSLHQAIEPPLATPQRSAYMLEGRESVAKKARYDGDDYRGSRDDMSLNTEGSQSRQPSHSPYPSHRGSIDSSMFPQPQAQIQSQGQRLRQSRTESQSSRREPWESHGGEIGGGYGPAGSQETFKPRAGKNTRPRASSSNICPRCRRLTTQQHDLDSLSPIEGGDMEGEDQDFQMSSNFTQVTQAAAVALTKILNTLSSGGSLERRSLIGYGATRDRQPFDHQVRHEFESADIPPIAQLGLKQTLDWLLGRIYLVNELADKLVQHVPPESLPQLDKSSLRNGTSHQDVLSYSMKRRIGSDSDDLFRTRGDGGESTPDPKLHTRRKSVATIPSSEDLPSMRSQHEYNPLHSADGPSRRASIMNPPPAPSRQLPSPPGRSLPSPTSINFPSPSTASYISSSHSMGYPPSSNLQPTGSYLPPIGSGNSDSALQAHSAALQHEVSVQKIALSSLQGEHDKLLAAFSRSQLRASTLEKKHSVSDNEIINLSDDKMRLQTQVTDLERDVEELTRSRDQFRQATVLEGAQYVEIVKKASRLEMMASEDRKHWRRLKQEMEQKIDSLSNRNRSDGVFSSTGENTPTARMDDVVTPDSSTEGLISLPSLPPLPPIPIPHYQSQQIKIEPDNNLSTFNISTQNESRSVVPPHTFLTSNPSSSSANLSLHPPQPVDSDDQTKSLQEEIRRLRNRCEQVEDTLRMIREESRSLEGFVSSLGLVGRSIADKVDRTLSADGDGVGGAAGHES